MKKLTSLYRTRKIRKIFPIDELEEKTAIFSVESDDIAESWNKTTPQNSFVMHNFFLER